MPKEAWLDAASRFNQQTKSDTTIRRREDAQSLRNDQARKDAEEDLRRRKAVAVQALEQFMQSDEAKAAKQLLTASRQIIRFAEEGDSQMTTVYFMDGNGLHTSYEAAASMSNAYATMGGRQLTEPRLSPASATEIVNAAVTYSKWQPDDFMRIFREALDKIASSAP